MRNKGLVGSITSFMSEPTVALNMVVNSFLDFKEGKISGKKFSRIVMSVATAEIVTAVMQSFITAARDDDEDKSYLEKYLKNVVSNSLSNFNLAGKIPYIRDIMSLWEGYDIERQDISAFSDLMEAVQTLTKQFKNDKTVKKQSEQYVKELKQNDTFNSFTDEDKEKLTGQVSSALAKEAMVKATEREPDEYDRLYKLYRTNKSGYNKLKKEMLAEGKTEKQINDGLELAKAVKQPPLKPIGNFALRCSLHH